MFISADIAQGQDMTKEISQPPTSEFEARPALGYLKCWLTKHSMTSDQARNEVDRIESFYSAYVLGVFRRPVTVGITANSPEPNKTIIRLQVIWPAGFPADRSARVTYENDIQTAFASEVVLPASPFVRADLEFQDLVDTEESAEALVRRVAGENGSKYIGLLDATQCGQMRPVSRFIGEMATAFAVARESTAAIRQIHELGYGLAAKPPKEQRALVKRARNLNPVGRSA